MADDSSRYGQLSHKVALIMKRCPNCKCEVIEWHSFCQDCHVHIPSYVASERTVSTYRGKVDRSWTTWLLIAGFVTGSGLLAGSIDWLQLSQLLRGQTMTAEEVARVNESVREKLDRRRVSRGRAGQMVDGSASQSGAVVASAAPTPVETATDGATPAASSTSSERGASLASYASYSARTGAEIAPDVEIQQVEAAPTERTGIVSINCQVPARIYINGQYSGTTPRAVHLNAGEYQIRLVSEGYLEWNSKVRVRDRQQMGVLASMTRAE